MTDNATTSTASQQLSPELVASLPDWATPEEAVAWPAWKVREHAMKRCSACGELKLLVEFHRMAGMRKGRHPRCKVCRAKSRG